MAKKSAQQIENETLKNKIKQLEHENKELRAIADSKVKYQKLYEEANIDYKKAINTAELFKNKYLALNNSIKYLCQANDNTLFSRD